MRRQNLGRLLSAIAAHMPSSLSTFAGEFRKRVDKTVSRMRLSPRFSCFDLWAILLADPSN